MIGYHLTCGFTAQAENDHLSYYCGHNVYRGDVGVLIICRDRRLCLLRRWSLLNSPVCNNLWTLPCREGRWSTWFTRFTWIINTCYQEKVNVKRGCTRDLFVHFPRNGCLVFSHLFPRHSLVSGWVYVSVEVNIYTFGFDMKSSFQCCDLFWYKYNILLKTIHFNV